MSCEKVPGDLLFFFLEDYIQPRGLCYLSLYWDCETLPLWKSSFVNNQPGFDSYGIFVAPVQVVFFGLAALTLLFRKAAKPYHHHRHSLFA